MTSWSTDRVASDILSNSSMQQIPPSLKTRAPLQSIIHLVNAEFPLANSAFTSPRQAVACLDRVWCMLSDQRLKNLCLMYIRRVERFYVHIAAVGIYWYQDHRQARHWFRLWDNLSIIWLFSSCLQQTYLNRGDPDFSKTLCAPPNNWSKMPFFTSSSS